MWVLIHYQQVALFSLKSSGATSSGGKTLLCPTPFAVKMALLDAAIRTLGLANAQQLWPLLRDLRVQLRLPDRLMVLHLFARIVRSRHGGAVDATGGGLQTPLGSTIAYREYVQYNGPFTLALQAASGDQLPDRVVALLPQVNYLGKRGGFIQCQQIDTLVETLDPSEFTLLTLPQTTFPSEGMIQMLDDCGPKMTLEHANIYNSKRIALGKERLIRHIVLPYRQTRTSRGFSLYERIRNDVDNVPLQITAQAVTPLELDDQSGAAIRGALTNSLWDRFCTNKAAPTCADCPLVQNCPVATLVAPMREEEQKGGDQHPRPYVIEPPLGQRRYGPGETLRFGLGLFGRVAALFPYLIVSVPAFEAQGLGRKLPELRHRRGRLQVELIESVSPLTGERQTIYERGQVQTQVPGIAITPADVQAAALALPSDRLTLRFYTPMRLTDQQRLVQQIALRPLIQRLMRRFDDLSIMFGEGSIGLDWQWYIDQAERVQVVDDQTSWVDVVSYSARQRRRTPIGGLVGQATFAGDLTHLRELLVWGSLIHVGKNAVKGDGWYGVMDNGQ